MLTHAMLHQYLTLYLRAVLKPPEAQRNSGYNASASLALCASANNGVIDMQFKSMHCFAPLNVILDMVGAHHLLFEQREQWYHSHGIQIRSLLQLLRMVPFQATKLRLLYLDRLAPQCVILMIVVWKFMHNITRMSVTCSFGSHHGHALQPMLQQCRMLN